jgi:hypothetical protein
MPNYLDSSKGEILDRIFNQLLKTQGMNELPFSFSESINRSDPAVAIPTKIIYVSPNTGSDDNDGLDIGRPLKTLTAAQNIIPNPMTGSVTIQIVGGGVIPGISWRKMGATKGTLLLIRANFPGVVSNQTVDTSSYNVLTTGTIASNASDPDNANNTATAFQSQNWTITVSGANYTVNAYKGKWLWLTGVTNSPGSIGTLRQIISNTSNTIEFARNSATVTNGHTFSIIDLNTTMTGTTWQGQSQASLAISGLALTGTSGGLSWGQGYSSQLTLTNVRQTFTGTNALLIGSGFRAAYGGCHLKFNNTGVTAIAPRSAGMTINFTGCLLESSSSSLLQMLDDFGAGDVQAEFIASTIDFSNGADFYLYGAQVRILPKCKMGTIFIGYGSNVYGTISGPFKMPTGLNKPAIRAFGPVIVDLGTFRVDMNTSTANAVIAEQGAVVNIAESTGHSNGGVVNTSASALYAKDGGIITVNVGANTQLVGNSGRFVCEARDGGLVIFKNAQRGNWTGTLGFASVDGVTPVASGALPVGSATEFSRIYQTDTV